MYTKYYYLFLLVPLFTKCFSYVHLVERVAASFQDSPSYTDKVKSCKNCKYYIENEKPEFSRCSKFTKQNSRNSKYIKSDNNTDSNELLNFYLATTCRNNEKMCGIYAKQYERKYVQY